MTNDSGRVCRSLLFASVSVLALTAGDVAQAQTLQDTETMETVTVTGTRIRGVAPVGSTVIPIDRVEFEKSGLTNSADLMRKIPEILSFGGNSGEAGGRSIQGAELNTTYANAPNLRGLGTAATLSLVNNHRVPAMGANMQLFDAETFPMIAIERLEVVADGASAIYGSDAISGVVNYILRKPFSGAEISAQGGIADGTKQYNVQGIFGRLWDGGGFMIAASHSHRDALSASDRADLYSDDYSGYGGTGSAATGYPGNIVYNGVEYGIPSGKATSLTLANLTTSVHHLNVWDQSDAIPAADIDNVTGQFNQRLFERIEVYGEGFYANRDHSMRYPRTGSLLTVPDSNPYSPCNPSHAPFTNANGIACTGSMQVEYNYNGDLGAFDFTGYERVYQALAGLKVDLPWSWQVDIYGGYGHSEDRSGYGNNINNTRLSGVLAGNVTYGGSTIPAFNPFCDGSGCNSATTLDYLKAQSGTGYQFDRDFYSIDVSGPLFTLLGGEWRLAVGAERYIDSYTSISEGNDTADRTWYQNRTVSPDREVNAVYGELFIPLVGQANALPLVNSLEFSLAWRYEDYSDFGQTSNPKLGLNWKPVDELRVHASYGTSFRAPSLADNNPASTAGFAPLPVAGSALTGYGYKGTSGTQLVLIPYGGNSSLKPEEAKTWTLGADWTPDYIPNLVVSATYYDIKYSDKIDYPAWNAGPTTVINDPTYSQFIVTNPTYFSSSKVSQAQYNQIFTALLAGTAVPLIPGEASPYGSVARPNFTGLTDPSQTIAIIDCRRNNTGIVFTKGFDLSANYTQPTSWGDLRYGMQSNIVMSYKTAVVSTQPVEEKVNYFGYPLRFRGRGEFGVDYGNFSATAFVNYTNSYKIETQFSASPYHTKIDSYTTIDLSFVYRIGDELNWKPAENTSLVFGVQNLFDATPPLVLNYGSPGVKFDNSNASSLGRFLTFQITKKL